MEMNFIIGASGMAVMGLALIIIGVVIIRKVYLMLHEITHKRIKAKITKITDYHFGSERLYFVEFDYNGKNMIRSADISNKMVGDTVYIYFNPRSYFLKTVAVEGNGYYWPGVLSIMMGLMILTAAIILFFPDLVI